MQLVFYEGILHRTARTTPNGVASRQFKFVALALTAPKAPLCKGSCQPNRLTEGLLPQYDFAEALQ